MTLTLKHFDILSQGEDDLNELAYWLANAGPQHLGNSNLKFTAVRALEFGAERLGMDVKDFAQAVDDAQRGVDGHRWWSDWACLAQRAAPTPKGWTEIVA